MPPYYARSQYARLDPNCSSLEFWRWFDDRCTPQERAYINAARDGTDQVARCKQVITKQGGWAHVQGRE